ncbi:L-threonylcarbamoyladenylate synthase [Alkalicoccus luteus]|uniref:Threonylcarbamoyl-AMP synthase n=1 Tax=Alkalicoccus luteus TaxID=1237094 RepID=A0A969PQ68_9BACI|nr:L-threonylcarbamoyladenylate synthase [Alkalicoccus luteus]NJP37378.1 threonylcarbamoyl-AMP synthase [Alkalicoccus luteus]
MDYQHTVHWSVDNVGDKAFQSAVDEAGAMLRDGKLIAFPTETVYGLGADARSDAAVEAVFQAKGRPADNPLIVHIADEQDALLAAAAVTETAEKLMQAFWPGALTIILPHNGTLSTKVTAGLPTVGIRLPDHPAARAVIRASGCPVAAPSANRSGRPSPTRAVHVAEDLDGRIAGVLDGGPTGVGLESTVIDCTVEPPLILRPGGVTQKEIENVIGAVGVDPALAGDSQPKSPGMKYRHYAPEAPLTLLDGSAAFMREQISASRERGERVGVILTKDLAGESGAEREYVLPDGDPETVARELYHALRTFKQTEVDQIFMQVITGEDLGFAVMNRLVKAAGGRVLTENRML